MPVEKDKVVSFRYSISDNKGQQLHNDEAAVYIHGYQQIVPALEAALHLMEVGDTKELELEAKDAYGSYKPDLQFAVPLADFTEEHPDVKVVAGDVFEAQGEGGEQLMRVVKVDERAIHFDGNHPLAGKKLLYSIEIEAVRDATSEELAKGEVRL